MQGTCPLACAAAVPGVTERVQCPSLIIRSAAPFAAPSSCLALLPATTTPAVSHPPHAAHSPLPGCSPLELVESLRAALPATNPMTVQRRMALENVIQMLTGGCLFACGICMAEVADGRCPSLDVAASSRLWQAAHCLQRRVARGEGHVGGGTRVLHVFLCPGCGSHV